LRHGFLLSQGYVRRSFRRDERYFFVFFWLGNSLILVYQVRAPISVFTSGEYFEILTMRRVSGRGRGRRDDRVRSRGQCVEREWSNKIFANRS